MRIVPLLALAAQPHLRAAFDAGRELQVDGLAVRERDALRLQGGRVLERHAQAIGDIGALGRRCRAAAEAGGEAAATAAAPASEQALENVAEIAAVGAEIEPAGAAAESTAAARSPAPGTEAERRGRIAVRVDLAAIELGALVLVVQQVIGGRHLAEALRRLRIVLVAIRVQLLRELAIRFLDVGLARSASDVQHGIWIGSHDQS